MPARLPARLQVIQHGACLGLGIAALGTEDEEAFEDVKNVLYMDNAGGEGACGCCGGKGGDTSAHAPAHLCCLCV